MYINTRFYWTRYATTIGQLLVSNTRFSTVSSINTLDREHPEVVKRAKNRISVIEMNGSSV